MPAIAAVNLLITLIETATQAMGMVKQVSALISKAQAEGRDITDAELNAIEATDDAARAALVAAIAKARAG